MRDDNSFLDILKVVDNFRAIIYHFMPTREEIYICAMSTNMKFKSFKKIFKMFKKYSMG